MKKLFPTNQRYLFEHNDVAEQSDELKGEGGRDKDVGISIVCTIILIYFLVYMSDTCMYRLNYYV